MSKKAKARHVNLADITRLVTGLDAYSAMSPVDPLRLRKIANKYESDKDINSSCKEVESDVWEIARIPSSSKEITRLSRIVGILKQVLMFIGLIVFTVYIIGSGLGLLGSLGH